MDLKQLFDKSQDGTPAQIAELSRKFGGRQPDAEMAAVLRVLVASDPKPFYELPPKLARLHPLPPTAVKALLKERGESTDPRLRVGREVLAPEPRALRRPGRERRVAAQVVGCVEVHHAAHATGVRDREVSHLGAGERVAHPGNPSEPQRVEHPADVLD
jgi:hypothetical protein